MPFKKKPSQFRGNKPKFYEKAGCWYSVRGRIGVEGFERVLFKRKEGILEIKVPEGVKSLRIWGRHRPLFVFREKSTGRIIVVSKGIERVGQSGRKAIMFNAYQGFPEPEKERIALQPLALAEATFDPKLKVVVSSNFAWHHEIYRSQKAHSAPPIVSGTVDLAPSWLQGKGFGLFLDSLRQAQLARMGARKWFANIHSIPESRAFAELRGFRPMSEQEADFLGQHFHFGYPSIEEQWLVKDLPPLRSKKTPAKRLWDKIR